MRIALALLVVLAACQHAAAPKSDAPFLLRTVNGQSLPATVGPFEVQSGSIELRRDSTYRDRVSYRYAGSLLADSLEGRYSRTKDSLVFFASERGYRYAAGFDGTTIVLTAWGFREEYRR